MSGFQQSFECTIYVTRLSENGVDPKTIMELMGHADIKMTMRYIHSSTKKKAAAVAGLGFGNVPSENPENLCRQANVGWMVNIWTPKKKVENTDENKTR